MLLAEERKEVAEVEESIKEVINTFKEEAEKLTNFQLALRTLAGKRSESEASLIPAEDTAMIHVHKILHAHGLVDHLPTYNSVFEALSDLEKKKEELKKQVHNQKSSLSEDVQMASGKISSILNSLDTGSQVMAPPAVSQGISQVGQFKFRLFSAQYTS